MLISGIVCLAFPAVDALEPGTWVLEVFPIFIGVPILIATARRFPRTRVHDRQLRTLAARDSGAM